MENSPTGLSHIIRGTKTACDPCTDKMQLMGDNFLSKHVDIIDLFTIAVWVPAKNSPTGLSRVVRGDQGRLSPMNW
ncbi:hypothetical protein PoB_004414700 [Plakobranchus ocellatus]|uniref:Uncharacterized protein n=1 Tax=Plakobranchus ocellatus TaxID=259542 RepID=A0AAV4BFB4_9GAST|nr:hypothetical protein PoB_004414700 [Plakobranchus ocellatus]